MKLLQHCHCIFECRTTWRGEEEFAFISRHAHAESGPQKAPKLSLLYGRLFGMMVNTSDCHPRGIGFDSRLYPRIFSWKYMVWNEVHLA